MKIEKIKMLPGNRMIRIGGGEHTEKGDNQPLNHYFRIDLWCIGFRFTK